MSDAEFANLFIWVTLAGAALSCFLIWRATRND